MLLVWQKFPFKGTSADLLKRYFSVNVWGCSRTETTGATAAGARIVRVGTMDGGIERTGSRGLEENKVLTLNSSPLCIDRRYEPGNIPRGPW